MKRSVYLFILLILMGVCFLIYRYNKKPCTAITESEYKTNIESIESRFENIKAINATYWKSGEIGGTGRFNIGPTSLWWRGYILLSEAEGKEIFNTYDWVECSEFDEEGNPKDFSIHGERISPDVTGFTNFKWFYSEEFYWDNRPKGFLGELYFDEINNIIYFDLESD